MLFCRGPGKISISPLRPPGDPVTPLKRSLREGYGTVRRVCAIQKTPLYWELSNEVRLRG